MKISDLPPDLQAILAAFPGSRFTQLAFMFHERTTRLNDHTPAGEPLSIPYPAESGLAVAWGRTQPAALAPSPRARHNSPPASNTGGIFHESQYRN